MWNHPSLLIHPWLLGLYFCTVESIWTWSLFNPAKFGWIVLLNIWAIKSQGTVLPSSSKREAETPRLAFSNEPKGVRDLDSTEFQWDYGCLFPLNFLENPTLDEETVSQTEAGVLCLRWTLSNILQPKFSEKVPSFWLFLLLGAQLWGTLQKSTEQSQPEDGIDGPNFSRQIENSSHSFSTPSFTSPFPQIKWRVL